MGKSIHKGHDGALSHKISREGDKKTKDLQRGERGPGGNREGKARRAPTSDKGRVRTAEICFTYWNKQAGWV